MLASAIYHLPFLSLIVSAFPSTTGPTRDISTNRYVPGSDGEAAQDLKLDDNGILNVDFDGVLRSFAPDGTIVDYRQLNPDQVAEFAAKQLAGWEAMPDHEVPASVVSLARTAPSIDGRLITNEDQLLYPDDKPDFPLATEGEAGHTSRAESRDVFDAAILEKKQSCLIGTPCFGLPECFAVNCAACYYPNGPPLGYCFTD